MKELEEGIEFKDLYETTLNNINEHPLDQQEQVLENLRFVKKSVNKMLESPVALMVQDELIDAFIDEKLPVDIMLFSALYYTLRKSKSDDKQRLAKRWENAFKLKSEYIFQQLVKQGFNENGFIQK